MDELKGILYELQEENRLLWNKVTKLEDQARRKNLVLYGITEDDKESWDETESKVKTLLHEELGISGDTLNIERSHRLGKPRPRRRGVDQNPDARGEHSRHRRDDDGSRRTNTGYSDDRPIIIKFNNWKQKEHVLREAKIAKNPAVMISEDFSETTRDIRRRLRPHFLDARERYGRTVVHMRYNRLVIRGIPYMIDTYTDELVEAGYYDK